MSNKIELRECMSEESKRNVWKAFFQLYPDDSHGIDNVHAYIEKVIKQARIIAAYDNDKVVGFIAFYANDYEKKVAYITQILVLTKYQKHKIGRYLLRLCEDVCRKLDFEVIRLEVNSCNYNAIGFYNHIGFVKEIEKEASIYMIKEI